MTTVNRSAKITGISIHRWDRVNPPHSLTSPDVTRSRGMVTKMFKWLTVAAQCPRNHPLGQCVFPLCLPSKQFPSFSSSAIAELLQLSTKRRRRGTKRKHNFRDTVLQVPIILNDNRMFGQQILMRCPDSVGTKGTLMKHFKVKYFERLAHAFKPLQPRYVKDTLLMTATMNRTKRMKKLKEPNDLRMVDDFLSLNGCERQDDSLADEESASRLRFSAKTVNKRVDPPPACDE